MHVPVHRRRIRAGLLIVGAWVSAACVTGASMDQKPSVRHVLAIGDSVALPGGVLTLTFEAVVEDSRCPTGTDCIWEGDAAVRVRVDERGKAASAYVLHTSDRYQQAFEHGDVRVRLVTLAPHPGADAPIRPADYRLTVTTTRK